MIKVISYQENKFKVQLPKDINCKEVIRHSVPARQCSPSPKLTREGCPLQEPQTKARHAPNASNMLQKHRHIQRQCHLAIRNAQIARYKLNSEWRLKLLQEFIQRNSRIVAGFHLNGNNACFLS